MSKKVKVKQIAGDFMLGFFASAIVTGVLQIILYPLINYKIGSLAYGTFLTIIGLVNTVDAVIGSTLNNIRLIHDDEYKKRNLKGDFNILLIILNACALLGTLMLFPVFFNLSYIQAFCIGILINLMAMRNYWMVAYRIILSYKKILFAHICLVVGYLIGCGILFITDNWLIPLVLGEVFCLIYIYITTDIMQEPYKFTVLKKMILKDFSVLSLTSLSANVLVYLDRLLLYPLIGGKAVTVYTVASLGGKYFGIVAVPMAGVLLSYYSQKDFEMTRRKFWITSLGIIFVSFLSLIVIVPVAPWIAKILYPDTYRDAMGYMFLANIAGILGVISNFIQPSLLKFAASKWQIIKEILYAFIYIGMGIPLLKQYGLMGFCIANILANLSRIILMLSVGHVTFRTRNIDSEI